jgi:hypothetical protein
MFDGARNFFVENVLASHDEFLALGGHPKPASEGHLKTGQS